MGLSVDARGSIAILTGAWRPEYQAEFVEARATTLLVHTAPDIEFLADLPPLRRLEIHHLPLRDIRPVESQSGLQTLKIHAYYKTRVDFARFTKLRDLHLDWGPGAESIGSARSLEELSVNRYPGSDLRSFRDLNRLRVLRIASARKLASLDGIEAFIGLTVARLLLLPVLTDLTAIAGLSASLQSLELNTCRRIGRLDPLAALTHLTSLYVNNCGEIESLAPIAGLPLKTMTFYESTNVRDGRLDILLELPALTDTSFADRRHYTHTMAQIERALSGRA